MCIVSGEWVVESPCIICRSSCNGIKCILGGYTIIAKEKVRPNRWFTKQFFFFERKKNMFLSGLRSWSTLLLSPVRLASLCNVLHKFSPIRESFGFPQMRESSGLHRYPFTKVVYFCWFSCNFPHSRGIRYKLGKLWSRFAICKLGGHSNSVASKIKTTTNAWFLKCLCTHQFERFLSHN